MSQWTHVLGCLNCSAQVAEKKESENGKISYIIPKPEEQFFLGPAEPELVPQIDKNRLPDIITYFTVREFSAPRMKPVIAKYIEECMPKGETGFKYYVNYTKNDHNLSANRFEIPAEQELFEKAIESYYNENDGFFYYANRSFAELVAEYKVALKYIEINTDFDITFSCDIRHCSGPELMKAFEKFTEKLIWEEGVYFNKGCVRWHDDCTPAIDYQVRTNNFDHTLDFEVLEGRTGKILASKTYLDGIGAETDHWKDYIY